MALPGRKFSSGGEYRFGFNGKENDSETRTQDYGMRIYDTRIAKFLSVDPLDSEYPWYSPYAFAGNNPIIFVDLDGAEEKISIQVEGAYGFKTTLQVPKGYTLEQLLEELRKPLQPKPVAPVENPFALSRLWLTIGFVLTPLEMGDQMSPMEQERFWQKYRILNMKPEEIQIITDNPSTLSDEYLMNVRKRLLNGTATPQDKLYRSEAHKRTAGANDKYEINPAHQLGVNYNPRKSVLPENHQSLWDNRSYYDEKSDTWWSVEGTGKKAVFHQFNGKNQGKYHYSGSSNGQNNKGKSVPIPDDLIPNELKKKVGYN